MNVDLSIFSNTLSLFASYLPNFLGAIFVAIIGIILGNWVKTLVVKALQMLKVENLLAATKFKAFLVKAEVTQQIEEILGSVVKWLIVLTFFIAAMNLIGLSSISSVLTGILTYIPSVISAIIVLLVGILMAGLVESLVKGALSTVDVKTARLMGKIASYTVVTIGILAAFSELKIAESFINILFIGFVSMISLGFGLAIGLGAKDVIGKILSDWYKNLQKELKK